MVALFIRGDTTVVPVPIKVPLVAASYQLMVPTLPVVDKVDVPLPQTDVAVGLPIVGASTVIVMLAVVVVVQPSVTVTVYVVFDVGLTETAWVVEAEGSFQRYVNGDDPTGFAVKVVLLPIQIVD